MATKYLEKLINAYQEAANKLTITVDNTICIDCQKLDEYYQLESYQKTLELFLTKNNSSNESENIDYIIFEILKVYIVKNTHSIKAERSRRNLHGAMYATNDICQELLNIYDGNTIATKSEQKVLRDMLKNEHTRIEKALNDLSEDYSEKESSINDEVETESLMKKIAEDLIQYNNVNKIFYGDKTDFYKMDELIRTYLQHLQETSTERDELNV